MPCLENSGGLDAIQPEREGEKKQTNETRAKKQTDFLDEISFKKKSRVDPDPEGFFFV